MAGEEKLLQILREQGKITDKDLEKLSGMTITGEKLVEKGLITRDDLNAAYAEQFGMEILRDLDVQVSKAVLKRVPYSFVKKHNLVPVKERNGRLIVAVSDPLHLEPLDELRIITGGDVEAVYCPKDIIVAAIEGIYRRESGAASQLIADLKKSDEADLGDGDVEKGQAEADAMVDRVRMASKGTKASPKEVNPRKVLPA